MAKAFIDHKETSEVPSGSLAGTESGFHFSHISRRCPFLSFQLGHSMCSILDNGPCPLSETLDQNLLEGIMPEPVNGFIHPDFGCQTALDIVRPV